VHRVSRGGDLCTRRIIGRLGCDFLTVFKGKADVVLGVDRGIIHQRMPVFCRELCQLIRQLFKGFEEGLVIGPLRLLVVDLFGDRIEAGLGFIESLGEAVIERPFRLRPKSRENRGRGAHFLL